MIRAGLLTIGDEILIGQIIDTNSSWLGKRLTEKGIEVVRRMTVGDDIDEIVEGMKNLGSCCDIVMITGGLGPTKDDMTKEAICQYFKTELYFDQGNYTWIEKLFSSFGRKPNEKHRLQAYLPKGCDSLHNGLGSAPGMIMVQDETRYIFTPGVPYEMKGIYEKEVLPKLDKWYNLPPMEYVTFSTVGIGEAIIEGMLDDIVNEMPDSVSLAYLPGIYTVRLRLMVDERKRGSAGLLQIYSDKIEERLGDIIYSKEGKSLEEVVGNLLLHQEKWLTLAESCTGGYVAHLITSVPGSSAYFKGGIVSYSNEIKVHRLNVDPKVIDTKGVVSGEVVSQMAENAVQHFNADVALSVSGIAGPDGGTPSKPVGTVWMAVSDGERTVVKKFKFGKNRILNIQCSATMGLNMIRKFLLGLEME